MIDRWEDDGGAVVPDPEVAWRNEIDETAVARVRDRLRTMPWYRALVEQHVLRRLALGDARG